MDKGHSLQRQMRVIDIYLTWQYYLNFLYFNSFILPRSCFSNLFILMDEMPSNFYFNILTRLSLSILILSIFCLQIIITIIIIITFNIYYKKKNT